MPDWNPQAYLKFETERSKPARDLVSRVYLEQPQTVLDVGCGPGNSTRILAERWPAAAITAIDNSPSMLEIAKTTNSSVQWLLRDAGEDISHLGQFDLIFSNAVFQWIPNNDILIPRLFSMVKPHGVLAAQVPFVDEMLIHQLLMDLVSSPKWSGYFDNVRIPYKVHTPEYYYDVLCELTENIELWETRYYHLMDSYEDILDLYRSTGLRPYLDCLQEEAQQHEFENDLMEEILKYYTATKDGKILFTFDRVFFTATR
ncbi:methyltransferase domain-containing protein [Dehalobacter sp. DCM]|uniref:methyltransferase domain-containing protein n=1 Tax=Dehalobacter sp. DCM TaxID=2907827 RepID=UPI00308122D8|nr:methyltransferase domain-containing protein [Dehalobacter sp. DCM]